MIVSVDGETIVFGGAHYSIAEVEALMPKLKYALDCCRATAERRLHAERLGAATRGMTPDGDGWRDANGCKWRRRRGPLLIERCGWAAGARVVTTKRGKAHSHDGDRGVCARCGTDLRWAQAAPRGREECKPRGRGARGAR